MDNTQRQQQIIDADLFVGTYNKVGKTYRDFQEEFRARFPDIWAPLDDESTPPPLRDALLILAENMSGFEPSFADVDADDLMLPGDARAGMFAEDLEAAKRAISALPEFRSPEFEEAAVHQLSRVLHYHPRQHEEAHEALRLHIAHLRAEAGP